jgi:hypothetical protein
LSRPTPYHAVIKSDVAVADEVLQAVGETSARRQDGNDPSRIDCSRWTHLEWQRKTKTP